MDMPDGSTDIVHPEVRAHINSLVSALGGVSADCDGQYQLGDDALEVLRDIKRWIRFYDEKTNRMDVARCIHQANLIEGDLLPILRLWPENCSDSKYKSRIALSCFEVMVPLLWPMERDKERMTINHHRHMPVLELAQVAYKRAIINFDGARVLHSAIRVALPSMAMPIGDRSQRDQGIIKLVLFFLRNVAAISQPPDIKYDGDETQISRSATIDAFSYQDIFHVLLMLASNMGEEFRTEDTTVMEIIYHLVKRVDIEKMFMSDQQLHKAHADDLADVMKKEKAMLNSYPRPTRHNRFGTMIWVKREDGRMSTLTGQDAIFDTATRQRKMDTNKTFKPTRRRKVEDKVDREMGPPAKLNSRANNQLRGFVEEFLDSGFNPLFTHVRKTIDREAPYVMQFHRRQFFYLIGWFLEAERMRRKAKQGSISKDEEVTSFNIVAGVLNQEMFITLNKALHEAYDYKDWHELTAVMRSFTQILMTVQEMMSCGREDDEEIAENILSRLFYEEATHDVIANIIRTYKDQGFDYLDAATELVHHFLRILESYSKQNVDMQVRSRKRTRSKKKAAKQAEGDNTVEDGDESDNDQAVAEKTSKERKFDFHRFAHRFTPQGVVNTFVTFTKFYRDLNETQLKRAHRYLYRVAFKHNASVLLFRVDIIHLLHGMIKGPDALDKSSPAYKDWEELVKQILRKCLKKMEERPQLVIEMLFSKIPNTAYFLEFGYEKQTISRKNAAKPATELEFRYVTERDKQIGIVVGALLDKQQSDHIAWVRKVVTEAEMERRAWEDAERARQLEDDPFDDMDEDNTAAKEPKVPPTYNVRPDDDSRKQAIFKNSHLRLLMTTSGLQRLGNAGEETRDTPWIIPGEVTADFLKDTLHYINQAEFSPPTFDEGVLAEHQLKRKANLLKKSVFEDDPDDEDGADFLDDEMLFPAGGPTNRVAIDGPAKANKKSRRRRKKTVNEDGDEEEIDDEEILEKRRKRWEKDLEKARKIKSALIVKEGDDDFDSDEDEAFFAREREIAARAAKAAQSAQAGGNGDSPSTGAKSGAKKRKSTAALLDDTDEDGDEEDDLSFAKRVLSSQEEVESQTDDTPVDGSEGETRKKRRLSVQDESEDDASDQDVTMSGAEDKAASVNQDEDDGDDEVPAPTRRARVRGGFVIDSDDDE